jgi:aspartate kinase
LPPIMVYKRNQALVTLQTTDFSFVEGKPINLLYEILEKLRIKPNLTQNGAITMIICIDDIPEKTEQLAILASSFFDVNLEKGLTLLTVRHYTAEYLQKKEANTEIIMEQRTSDTIQRLMK